MILQWLLLKRNNIVQLIESPYDIVRWKANLSSKGSALPTLDPRARSDQQGYFVIET